MSDGYAETTPATTTSRVRLPVADRTRSDFRELSRLIGPAYALIALSWLAALPWSQRAALLNDVRDGERFDGE